MAAPPFDLPSRLRRVQGWGVGMAFAIVGLGCRLPGGIVDLAGLRNSLWAQSPEVIDRFVRDVRSCGQLRVNDSHLAGVPFLSNHGGPGLSGDRFAELNYPMLRTSRLRGVSVARSAPPSPAAAAYVPAQPRPRVGAARAYPSGWPPEELPGGLPAPFTEAFHHDPYPTLHWLREHRPLSRVLSPDGPGWLLTRYDDVRTAHTDPRVTCDSKRIPAGLMWLRHWPSELRERLFVHLLDSDDPRHAELRAIMRPFFTPARQEQWRSRVQRLVDARIDRIVERGRGDLMAAVAYPLGGNVLFSVLGATPPRMNHLRAMIWRTAEWNNDVPYVEALAHEVDAFVRGAVAEKRRSLGDDLISLLVRARDQDGLISEDELHGLVMMMLVAGQAPASTASATACTPCSPTPANSPRSATIPPSSRPAWANCCATRARCPSPVGGAPWNPSSSAM